MSVFPKFIIEKHPEGTMYMVLGKCTYHKQLAANPDHILGGGWWIKKDDTFTLHGDSHDFGKATLENIQKCVENKRVFSSKAMVRNLTDTFKFVYQNQVGETTNLF